jgi:hypothetical protein
MTDRVVGSSGEPRDAMASRTIGHGEGGSIDTSDVAVVVGERCRNGRTLDMEPRVSACADDAPDDALVW